MTACFLRIIGIAWIAALMPGCVEPYGSDLAALEGRLVVEADLSDQPERQVVRLTEQVVRPFNEILTVGVSAGVALRVNGSQVVAFQPGSQLGEYVLPEGFRLRAGERYQLLIGTSKGRYESDEEIMPAAATGITRVYDRFEPEGIANAARDRFQPAHALYVDTQDPAGKRNFYRWTWTLWERQDWCASCQPTALPRNPLCSYLLNGFDYECRSRCWDLIFSDDIDLFADTYSDGRPILARRVGLIPYYQAAGALVEVRQFLLTPGAYRFFKRLEDQTENTGTLTDTPPSTLLSNIHNVSRPEEAVFGYFSLASVSRVRYWLDRQNATTDPIGLFRGIYGPPRPVPEPFSLPPMGGPRPPTVVCQPGPTRTPVQPEGWKGP